MTYLIASGLRARGHDTTLFAKVGSHFEGNLVMPPDAEGYPGERALAREAYRIHQRWPFDVLIDHGHLHLLSRLFPALPIVNVFHDMYQAPSRNQVLLSEGQRAMMPPAFEQAVIIHNALDPAAFTPGTVADDPPYVLFLGALSSIKQPLLAIEACARFGCKLVMAGQELIGRMPWTNTGNVQFVGPVGRERRDALLRGARLLLQLGTTESFGLTTLEAGLCGTPVVAWPAGGSLDLVRYGVSGVFVPTLGNDMVQNVCDAMERAWYLPRGLCREYAEAISQPDRMLDRYEDVLERAVMGGRW